MSYNRPIILLEFNELCPPLLDKWMKAGELPNFKRFYEASDAFITKPDVEDPSELEPWIQWYSIHTGLPYSSHKVFHLTDGPGAGHDDIWRALGRAGVTTGNFSSMNAAITPMKGHFGLPDPWCTSERSHPPALQPFQDFIQRSVQEHTNRSHKDNLQAMARLGAFLASHGLSARTTGGIVRQLFSEKVGSAATYWKRAVQLDRLLFDVFQHYYRKFHPGFSSFFLNSTAHYQHGYWRHMDPDAFQHSPTDEEMETYQNAILFGYKNMDRILEGFFKLERESGAMLILMTALSQQPFLKYENIGGQNFYRPHNMAEFFEALSIEPVDVQPVMTHQYAVRFASVEEAHAARDILAKLTIDEAPVFELRVDDDGALYLGCQLRTKVPQDAAIQGTNASLRFGDIFYKIEETKSGCHHPDGVLWIKTGAHAVHEEKVSILDIHPTLLEWFGAPAQSGEAYGASLIGKLSQDAKAA